MMPYCATRASRSFPGRRWRAAICGLGVGPNAATVRGRTDRSARCSAGSKQDEAIRSRGGGRRDLRREAPGRGARLGAVETGRDRADHRRLQAAPSGRRRGGPVAQARRRGVKRLEEPYRPKAMVGHV